MPRNSLLWGAVILFGANVVNRFLGFIYQYLIMRHVGSEAYGLFSMVFPLYMTALVLTTAGIPLAVSKIVSEKMSRGREEEALKVFHTALLLLTVSGFVISGTLFLAVSTFGSHFFADSRILPVFKVCLPAIFIVSVASAFRGYFQGMQNMLPSAVSQTCEQIFRVVAGFTLAMRLLPKGLEWAATGLAIGMVGGELVGLIVIYSQYARSRRKRPVTGKPYLSSSNILRNLLILSLPVTGSRLLTSVLSSLDAILIPRQLQIAGNSAAEATSLFGQLNGAALTLITFPSVFTFALAVSLLPAVSNAVSRQNYRLARKQSLTAIRMTILLGLPCVIILFAFAQPFTNLFRSADVAPVLRILCFGGLFIYLQQTTTGILQGLGKTYLPFIYTLASSILRLPLLVYLTGLPAWGLKGTALSLVIGYACCAALNLLAVQKALRLSYDLSLLVYRPLLAGLIMVFTIYVCTKWLPVSLFTSLLISGVSLLPYFAALFISGSVRREDLAQLPVLNRFFS